MTEILERDDVFEGPLRRPRNLHQQAPNSIHNDAVAKKLGFRGGTVAGSIHMEQFPPLLLRAFGDAWWESGNLSLYFTHATTDAEDVRCFVARPEPEAERPQVDVRMERDDGTRVCEGTASVGRPQIPSALRERIAHLREPGELRMLAGLAAGTRMEPRHCRIPGESVKERMTVITEPLDAYEEASRFGGRVLTPTILVQALRRAEAGLPAYTTGGAVGLFGAIEIENLGAPALADHDYVASGEVLAVGDTPKTEFFFYESEIAEAEGGDVRARMIMMLRFMKGSSSHYSP